MIFFRIIWRVIAIPAQWFNAWVDVDIELMRRRILWSVVEPEMWRRNVLVQSGHFPSDVKNKSQEQYENLTKYLSELR